MTTAQERLNSILPSWYELLTQWSLDGSLVAAATEALMLDGSNAEADSQGQLQSLVSQWSVGDFQNLPQIVLLSGEDMAGAFGAYADSTDTIYLNADWLLTATQQQIQKVLTEELGHSLDDQLNLVDTTGDEGEFFVRTLSEKTLFTFNEQQIVSRQDDSGIVVIAGSEVSVENASFPLYSAYQSPSSSIQPSLSATLWENPIGTQWSETIVGSAGDDIYRATNYATGPIHAATNGLNITDLSGNSFVSASSYNWPFGPNGAILNSKFSFGDGYVNISATGYSGNYVYGLVGSDISMGSGDSDINVIIDGSAYYSCFGFNGKIDAGAGSDVLNVYLGYIGDANTAIGSSIIDMGGGNDVVSSYTYAYSYNPTWTSRALASSTIFMGSGDDIVDLYSTFFYAISDSTIDMGTGNDGVILSGISSNAAIGFGEGLDELIIKDTSYDYIVAKQGNDSWKITKASDLQFSLVVTGLEEIKFDDRTRALNASFFTTPSYLNGNSLYKVTQGLNWLETQAYSRAFGGDLVTINSSIENDWLSSNLPLGYEVNIGLSRSYYPTGGPYETYNFDWKWSDGTPLSYDNWNRKTTYPFSSEATNLSGPTELYGLLQFPGAPNPGTWYSGGGNYTQSITEYSLNLSIDTTGAREGGSGFSTNLNLSAGSQFRNDLVDGATIYWSITGIDSSELSSGQLTGEGVVANGKLVLNHSLKADDIQENDSFNVSVYSDSDRQVQIGSTVSFQIADSASPSLVVAFDVFSSSISGAIGIDYSPSLQNLILTANYPSGYPANLFTLSADQIANPYSSISGFTEELKIATVKQSGGGFTQGELFLGNGIDGEIVRVSSDGKVVTNPWVQLPGDGNGLFRGSLFHDNTGVFSGDLIAVTTSGQVWRITSTGVPTLLASLGTHLEGLVVVPDISERYGPLAGKILIGAESLGRVYTVSTTGEAESFSINVNIEDIDIVAAGSDFYGVDYANSRILYAAASSFAGLEGEIVVVQEGIGSSASGLYRLYWDGTSIQTQGFDLASGSAAPAQWEHVTFAPSKLGTTIPNDPQDPTYDFAKSNNLVITGPGSGTLDGIPFSNTYTIDLGLASDTAKIDESAGLNTEMTVSGGDDVDSFYGNSLDNILILTGVNEGILDGVAFSGFENVYLGAGNDKVYIKPGGRLTGTLDGGGGDPTPIILDPPANPGGGSGGDGSGGGGVSIPLPYVPPGSPVDGGNNSIYLNDDPNILTLTGPGAGVVDGTSFTNFYAIEMRGGDDFAFINEGGSLTGVLDGGLDVDSLTLNAAANVLTLDRLGKGKAAGTSITGFETFDLAAGNDAVTLDLSASTTEVIPLPVYQISGGADSDQLNLILSAEEVTNLTTTGQLAALRQYLSNPTGQTITVSFLAGTYTFTGFEAGTGLPDPPVINLSVSPESVLEDGSINLVYTFTRTGSLASDLIVNYTVGGTADSASDFTGLDPQLTTRSVTFAAGSNTAILTIDPTVDTVVEEDETVVVSLADGDGYTLGSANSATGTILNDDQPVISVVVSPSRVSETGAANLIYTFSRTGPTTKALTVSYDVSGTATLETDYTGIPATPGSKTITFVAGSSTATLTVDPTPDTLVEADESVVVSLANGSGYVLGTPSSAIGIIDSTAPTLVNVQVQGNSIFLQFNEDVTATSVPVSCFKVESVDSSNKATLRTVTNVNLIGPSDPSRVILTLSGTTPTSTVGMRISYTDPVGDQITGVIQDIAGNDLMSFANVNADTYVSANNATLASQYRNLTLTGSFNATGTGNASANRIIGNDGNNVLDGLTGNDSLTGGLGSDKFVFSTVANSTSNRDIITDFTSGVDKIQIKRSAYPGLSGSTLTTGQFESGAGLLTASTLQARFLYDTSTGILSFDRDGSGTSYGPTQMAVLGAGTVLQRTDFVLV